MNRVLTAWSVFLCLVHVSLEAQDIFGVVRSGDIDGVKVLIEADPKLLSKTDAMGRTPLHWAALENRPDIGKYMIAKGADVNARDKGGNTPLMSALVGQSRALAKTLIEAGTDCNMKNGFNLTALHNAIRFDFTEEAVMIIDKEVDLNARIYDGKTAVHLACQGGKTEILKRLLAKGAKVDLQDSSGNSPLHTASYYGDGTAAEFLLAGHADVNGINLFGQTPLHQAAAMGYGSLADLLVRHGAGTGMKDFKGRTPGDLALEHNNRSLAERLSDLQARKADLFRLNDPKRMLKKDLEPGEALIWHLGNCGWAVKTKNRLLVFDYWNYGAMPDQPSLANGRLVPDEIEGLDILFFITHGHYDHFDKSIFAFDNASPNVRYVFGWNALDDPRYCCLNESRTDTVIDGVQISNIACNSESAFLVKTDGVTIYHAGDYLGDYASDHVCLASKQDHIDLLFSDYKYHPDVCISSIEKLKPRVFFPMHKYGCEYLLKQEADILSSKFPDVNFQFIENRGDSFFFNKKMSEARRENLNP